MALHASTYCLISPESPYRLAAAWKDIAHLQRIFISTSLQNSRIYSYMSVLVAYILPQRKWTPDCTPVRCLINPDSPILRISSGSPTYVGRCTLASSIGLAPSSSGISPSCGGMNSHLPNFSRLRCTPSGALCAMDRVSSNQADDSCWTCRPRRWKCDRTLQSCCKCAAAGQPCLGYGKERPLRWTNNVASRGKLMGKTVPRQATFFSIGRLFVDPDLQNLPTATRGYIA